MPAAPPPEPCSQAPEPTAAPEPPEPADDGNPYPPTLAAVSAQPGPGRQPVRLILSAAAIVIVLSIVGAVSGGGTDRAKDPVTIDISAFPSATQTTADQPHTASAGLGESVTVAGLAFAVHDVETAVATVGAEPLMATADGEYVIIQFSVDNAGGTTHTFHQRDQVLLDIDNQAYEADSTAAFYLPGATGWLEALEPGRRLETALVFDVPAGTAPLAVELRTADAMVTVTVNLEDQEG